MNNQDREIYQDKIFLGEKAREVLGGPIGSLIVSKAHEDVEAALDDLLYIDPHDASKVTNIQVRIRAALAAPQWLNDAIIAGSTALSEYMQLNDMEKLKEEGTR